LAWGTGWGAARPRLHRHHGEDPPAGRLSLPARIHGHRPTTPETIYAAVHSTVKELHWLEHSSHTLLLCAEREQAFEFTLRFIQQALG
jgi:hypothetical protein